MDQKTKFHKKGEADVKHAIAGRNPESNVIVGREFNPAVAEAMAYAAKPFIDGVLEDLKGEPNSVAIFKGKGVTGGDLLNRAPGVKVEGQQNGVHIGTYDAVGRFKQYDNSEVTYKQLKDRVERGYMEADAVQRESLDNNTVA